MPDILYSPVFAANKDAYESNRYRVISNQGSSRSGKTYGISQLLIAVALTSKKEITVCSPSLPHLKKGAMKNVLNILMDWGIYDERNHNKTDSVYRFPSTGSYIEFFGVEDPMRVRGPDRDILFINEADLIDLDVFRQLSIRTREQIFIDFNPADDFNWVYDVTDKPVKEGKKPNLLIHSTYKNNLQFLTQDLIDDIEALKDADENLWKVYGLGLRGTSSETIYTHYKQCDQFPQCDRVWFGLDFGFNHPNAMVRIGELDDRIYVEEMIYETKLTTDELTYLIKTMGIGRTFELFCDSARPDTIEELRRAGLNAMPSDKSVWDGIQFVKSKQVYITKNSINLLKELRSYKWQVDKNGKVMEQPVKFRDDLVDAMRYGIYTKLSKPKILFADADY